MFYYTLYSLHCTKIKLTCLGIPSQQIPNNLHFLGVRKYIGPDCCGLLWIVDLGDIIHYVKF